MKLEDAMKLQSLNEHLIGKKIRDSVIDDIVIVPNDSESVRTSFFKSYLYNFDRDVINLFKGGTDYRVVAIHDFSAIRKHSVLLHSDIENIKQEDIDRLKVVLEIEQQND